MIIFALMGSGDYAVASAVSIIFIIPVLVLLILTSRYLTEDKVPTGGINGI